MKRYFFPLFIILLLTIFSLNLCGCSKLTQLLTPGIQNSANLEQGVLFLEYSDANTDSDKYYQIELKAASIDDLKGYSVILKYDPTILDPIEIEEGACLSENNKTFFWNEIDTEKGKIQIDCAVLGFKCSAIGEGSLATIRFTSLRKGNTGINFSLVQARDMNNSPISTIQKSIQVRSQ